MIKGALVYEDYKNLIKKNYIIFDDISSNQIQPSSIDLTLSEECYEISSSFLSISKSIRENLKNIQLKKIDLNKKYLFKKNKTFLVKINEKLNLINNIFGICNPKSSTGRLDIFCRTIVDYNDEYEKIPSNYKGEIFIEITSHSFDIEFQKGDSLNQMRLIFTSHQYLNDSELKKLHKFDFLTKNHYNKIINPNIHNGLKLSVDLSNKNLISAYVAKKNTPTLCFQKTKFHNKNDFWQPIQTQNNRIVIEKNNFYILKSKEKIQIPKNMAGEMVPYDTNLGDFRVHYAGFFDPGFGKNNGTYAVLEVKTHEVSFILEDKQSIARLKYEKLNKESKMLYGLNLKSNYQNQSLALSKHFV